MEIQKCLKICKEGKNKKVVNQDKNLISEKSYLGKAKNVAPIELSDEIKKILEKPKDNFEFNKNENESSKIEDLNKDLNSSASEIEIKNQDNDSRIKNSNQENKNSKSSSKSTPVTKKDFIINLDGKLSRKQSKIVLI